MSSAVLRGEPARYQRIVEGWIDATPEDGFTHTVRLTDDDAGVELRVVALPSPTYAIRSAAARRLTGDVAPAALDGIAGLAGAPMTAGLGRRTREAVGQGAGAGLLADAVIEVARLARQVTRLPRERVERLQRLGNDPAEAWQLDTEGWVDLPGSCFTYSDAGRALLGTRPVTLSMRPEFYHPAPGQARVFERRKVARLERAGDRLTLFHSMHDSAHGLELTYEVDLPSGRILGADSVTPKLPYMGICSEPQARIRSLIGETLDAGLPRRIQGLLGGGAGCAQLYDLTSDLLRLALAPR